MWPLPKIKNERIELVLHQQRATCIRFVRENSRVCLEGYREYQVPVGNERLLYNITALQDAVNDFINGYQLQYAHLNIILGADMLTERLLPHGKSDPRIDELISEPDVHTRYRMHYIGPQDDHFVHYVCELAQPLAFQLHILHLPLQVHMQRIYSPLYTQIEVFKYISGKAFCKARLMQELDMANVSIPAVFSPEAIRRSVHIDAEHSYVHQDVVYALGSYLGV